MKRFLLLLLSLVLILFPSCNQKDVCPDDTSGITDQTENNNYDISSELPEDDQGNKDGQNNDPQESVSTVSITDAEKAEIQNILASAEQIDVGENKYAKAIYHTARSEKLFFMADRESVSCRVNYEPVIIDECDIFDGISESRYMYLFFNYTDDGKAYKEDYDSAYNFRVGSYTQGFSDAVCFVFNREITAEVSCTAPSERMAIIKMPIVEDVDLFEVRLYKYYENELASIKDMIQDPTPSVRYKLPDVSDMAGNLKVESCFFDIKDNYILPEEIFVYNQDKYSENALIYTEKELFPESEEENLYLLFSFELSSDRAYTLIGDSANLNSGIVELKFKLVESSGDDAFTKYVVMLKLNGSNGIEQITDLHLEIGYIPYSEYN